MNSFLASISVFVVGSTFDLKRSIWRGKVARRLLLGFGGRHSSPVLPGVAMFKTRAQRSCALEVCL